MMKARRFLPLLALVATLATPLAAAAQDQPPPAARGRSGFMMSARLMTPWTSIGTSAPIALPDFVIGAQLGNLGIGAGINIFSWDNTFLLGGDATLFLLGPTFTYAIAKGAGGRTQLHLLGSLSFGMGSAGDVDVTALGFDFGVLGRGMILDAFGIDVGVVFDFLSINLDPDDPDDDDETNRGVQIVGFLGGTFIL
jgi:hypothetical protein